MMMMVKGKKVIGRKKRKDGLVGADLPKVEVEGKRRMRGDEGRRCGMCMDVHLYNVGERVGVVA